MVRTVRSAYTFFPFYPAFAALVLAGIVRVEPSPYDFLVASLLIWLLVKDWRGIVDAVRNDRALLSLTCFGVVVLASTLLAGDPAVSVRYAFITTYLIASSGFWGVFVSSVRQKTVLTFTVTGVVLSCSLALVGALAGGSLAHLFLYQSLRSVMNPALDARNGSWLGFFKDPNVFAAFTVSGAILVAAYATFHNKSRGAKVWLAGLQILLFACIFFSFSRGAILNLTVALLLLALYAKISKRLSLLTANIVPVAIAALVALSISGKLGYLLSRAGLQADDAARFAAQWHGLTGFYSRILDISNLLLGIGSGMFESTYQGSAHSLFIRVISENGVLGLALLSFFIITVIVRTRTVRPNSASSTILDRRVLIPICLGILAQSLFYDTLHWRFFWFYFGLLWASGSEPVQHHIPSPPSSHKSLRGPRDPGEKELSSLGREPNPEVPIIHRQANRTNRCIKGEVRMQLVR
jgi:hypothetical protein